MFTLMKKYRADESGAAMITALLFAVIMTFLITSISVTAISGLQKGKAAQETTGLSIVVDSALSNALAFANNPMPGKDLDDHLGIAKAQYGVSTAANVSTATVDGKYKWLWYTERVQDAVIGESYDIIATAYVNAPTDVNARSVRVRMQALPVQYASYKTNGTITYSPIAAGAFSWGLLGTNGVTIGDGANVKSYNSAVVSNPVSANDTQNGTISSNANVNILGTDVNSVKRIVMLKGDSSSIPVDRCTTTANCNGKMTSFAYAIGLESISELVRKACPNAANTYPDWRASTKGGEFDPADGKCFNNVIFDAETDVAYGFSSGKPAEMYVAGNITVNAGVQVNQEETRGGPLALRIYSAAGTSAKFNSGTTASPTRFSGMVSGINLACSDTGATGKSFIFKGSMACNTISLGMGSQVWWDQQTVQVIGAGRDRTITTIWSPTSYDPQYK